MACPNVPLAVPALVITGAGGLIVKANETVPVPTEFVALSTTFHPPVAVGVPVIWPVVLLMVRPGGNPEAPKLVGLLLAVIA